MGNFIQLDLYKTWDSQITKALDSQGSHDYTSLHRKRVLSSSSVQLLPLRLLPVQILLVQILPPTESEFLPE